MIEILLGLFSDVAAAFLAVSKSRFAQAMRTGLLLIAACFIGCAYLVVAVTFDYQDSASWASVIGVLFIVVVTLILWTILRPVLIFLIRGRRD